MATPDTIKWQLKQQAEIQAYQKKLNKQYGLESPGTGITPDTALNRWLDQQKQAQEQFSAAQQPLQQAVQMFQPGGGYGQGQATLLRDEARRAGAEATTQQVASGMSSGSLATGTGLRIKKDLAQGLAGVEDQRTQFLAQALQMLSGARQGQAQTTATVYDPTYAPTMGARASMYGTSVGAQTAAQQTKAQQNIAQVQAESQAATNAMNLKIAEMKQQQQQQQQQQPPQGKYSTPTR